MNSKKLVVITLSLILFGSCNIKKRITGLQLVAKNAQELIIIDRASIPSTTSGNMISTKLPTQKLFIDENLSGIIINDTVVFLAEFSKPISGPVVDTKNFVQNVVIASNLNEGEYHCQSLVENKFTCEKGIIETHFDLSGLTPNRESFPAADYHLVLVSSEEICFLPKTVRTTESRICISTAPDRICIARLDGIYYVYNIP